MKIEKKLEIIKKYNSNADFVHAKQLLSSLLTNVENKNNIGLIIELGQMYAGTNDYEKSKKCFLRVLKINKDNLYALFGICRCCIALNSFTAVKRTMKLITQILKERNKKEEYNATIANFFKDILYNKVFNEKYNNENNKNNWLRLVIDNINEISTKEKISLINELSSFYRKKREFKKEKKIFVNIIAKDNSVIEINEMFVNLLIDQGRYKEAYKKTKNLKLKNKDIIIDYIVNNLIEIDMNNEKNIVDMNNIDALFSIYFKLSKIKYLKKESNFLKKMNSFLMCILIKIRQNNYKVKNEIYYKILKKIKKDDFNIKNSIINEIEYKRKKIILHSKPRVAQIMVTDKCNSECRMCGIGNKHKWELNDNGFKNVSKLLKYLDSVIWQGGEVQFYNRFEELIDFARKYNVSQHIITNGINWEDKMLEKVLKGDMSIAISLDAFDRDTYMYIRGVNCFDAVKSFISKFNRYRTSQNKLKMYTTVMNVNVEQLRGIPEFAIKNKIDEVVLSPLKKLQDNDFFQKENIFFEKDGIKHIQYNNRIKSINGIVENLSTQLLNLKIKFISYLPKIYEKNIANDLCVKDSCGFVNKKIEIKNTFCQAPWQYLAITEKGLIVPSFSCGQPMILGDINSNDIFKIWNSKKMRSVRQDIINSCAEKWCGTCKSLNC